jgi:hypothetical protein
MRKITYAPTGINNFHNSRPLVLVISGREVEGDTGMLFTISKGQAKKIERHFCGVIDCRCPAGAAIQLNEVGTLFGIRSEWTWEWT